jgi:Uma2 family endonuclease
MWNTTTNTGEVVPTPGIIFSDDDAVAPDLIWVSKERLAVLLGEDGKLHGAPELVIEVLSFGSANEGRDKDAKRKLYSVRGVSEYWIVDWRLQSVEIYRREAAVLQLVATLRPDDELTSSLLPDFKLKVSRIFE